MPKFVSIHANGNKGPVVTVTEAFAESIGAKVLKSEPAVDPRTGRPLPAREAGEYAEKNTTTSGGRAASKPEEASK